VIYSNEERAKGSQRKTFDEVSASLSGISIEKGFTLIERFLSPCCSS